MPDDAGAAGARADLEAEWLKLTRGTLPGLRALRMSGRCWADHCFQRILLDAVVAGCGNDAVAGRSGYRWIDAGFAGSRGGAGTGCGRGPG